MQETNKMHKFIEDKRLINRISYKEMGSVIGYSDTGFQRALKGGRLSLTHINMLVDKYGLRQEFDEIFGKTDNTIKEPDTTYTKALSLDQLELEVVKRFKELKDREVFKRILEAESSVKVAKEVLRIVSDKKELEKYLKQ